MMIQRALGRIGFLLDSVPLRLKVTGLVLGVTFLLGSVSAVELRRDIYFNLSGELDFRGVSIAQEMAARAGDDLATRDLLALHVLLDSAIRHNQDMSYAFITDAQGRAVASTFLNEVPEPLLRFDPPREGFATGPTVTTLDLDDTRIREIRVSVYDDSDHPMVRVGMSEERIESAMAAANTRLIELTLLAGTLAVLIGLLLSRLLLAPLEDLIAGMKRVGQGDLDHRVEPTADQDLAFLSNSFNEMADDLKSRRAQHLGHQRRIESQNRELRVLQRLSNVSRDATSSRLFLDDAVNLTVSELSAVAGWACVADGDGGTFCSAVGIPLEYVASVCIEGCLGACALAGEVISVQAPPTCPVQAVPDWADSGTGASGQMRASLAPVHVRDGLGGVVALVHVHDEFDEDIRSVLSAVGGQIGVVLENLRLLKERQSRETRLATLLSSTLDAQENERRRVARELHDDIGQKMTYLKLGLSVLRAGAKSASERERLLGSLWQTVSEGIDSIRRTVSNLGPAPVDELGLVPALERLLREAGTRWKFTGDLQLIGSLVEPLEPSVPVAAYRMVQEALSNAGKHSGCSRVSVILRSTSDALEIVVEDDGCGFNPDSVAVERESGRHLGLDGMRERMEIVGGRLFIESTLGVGTAVHMRMPLSSRIEVTGGVVDG